VVLLVQVCDGTWELREAMGRRKQGRQIGWREI